MSGLVFSSSAPLYSPSSSFSFSNMGATGAVGPISITYGTSTPGYGTPYAMTLNGGIQYWTVPATGIYNFTVAGAGSFNSSSINSVTTGYGIVLTGNYLLVAGQILAILVGQQGNVLLGGGDGGGYGNGGSGGTYVTRVSAIGAISSATPLFIAGGAGGIGYESSSGANSTVNGTISITGRSAPAGGGTGGTGPSGGNINSNPGASRGGGGAGFSGNGTIISGWPNAGAKAFTSGGVGDLNYVNGGFGGGAGATGAAGGGGGGYGGGGGGVRDGSGAGGGGGGSYDITGAYSGSATNAGMGYVTVAFQGYYTTSITKTIPTPTSTITNTGAPLFSQLSTAARNSAVGAFSLRAVNGTSTKAVNVRNGTTSATQDFYADRLGNLLTVPITGQTLAAWLNGATGYIATWYDQSSAANHATQTTAANQPAINLTTSPYSVVGGGWVTVSTFSFNFGNGAGYSIRMLVENTVGGTVVYKGTTALGWAGDYKHWSFGPGGGSVSETTAGLFPYCVGYNENWTYSGTAISSLKTSVTYVANNNTQNATTMYINASQVALNGSYVTQTLGSDPQPAFVIGNGGVSGGPYPFNGNIYEVLVFSKPISSSDVTIMG